MRVIGGTYRRRKLRTLASQSVRPTSDRLRETLFNILAPRIEDSRFLDICAGSGAVGIEALSRGAREVTFIERSRRACAVIEANLQSLGIDRQTSLFATDVFTALKELAVSAKGFDIVFFDPPYASKLADAVLNAVASPDLLTDRAMVIVEHRVKSPPSADSTGKLRRFREVKQGESALTFYEFRGD